MISELPHSREAERCLVGCPLKNESPDQYLSIAECVEPEDIFLDSHREIFLASGRVVKRGGELNIPLVAGELHKAGAFPSEQAALLALSDIVWGLPAFTQLKSEVATVRETSLARRILRLKNEADTYLISDAATGPELLEFLESGVADLRALFKPPTENPIIESGAAIDELMAELEAGWLSGKLPGSPVGIPQLDDLLGGGLQASKLYCLAAKTGYGKSWVALNCSVGVIREGKGVLYVSLEMPPVEMAMRFLSHLSGIDSRRIRCNNMDDSEKKWIQACMKEIKTYSITYGSPGARITIGKIRHEAKKIARKHELGLIVIDYLQLLDPEGTHGNREREVASVSKGLKRLSTDMKVPVLALSQLNRKLDNVWQGQVREPELSDLRESGAIEQDSDVVLFFHGDPEAEERIFLLKKQRGGPTGRVKVLFDRKTGRLRSHIPPPENDYD